MSERADFPSEYSCECTKGWTLRRCDKPNLCLSHPCHYNATCLIRESGDYECLCDPGWPCAKTITAVEIAVYVLSMGFLVVLAVVVVVSLLIYLKQRKTVSIDLIRLVGIRYNFVNQREFRFFPIQRHQVVGLKSIPN